MIIIYIVFITERPQTEKEDKNEEVEETEDKKLKTKKRSCDGLGLHDEPTNISPEESGLEMNRNNKPGRTLFVPALVRTPSLVFVQQNHQAEDQPEDQEVRGHEQEGHRVKVPSGRQTPTEPEAPETRGTLVWT